MPKYENLLLNNQLCFALYAATNAITRSYRNRLSKVGLTYSQYLVMMVLWEQDDLTIKTIAAKLHLDSATITPLVKRLEKAELLTKERNVSDERVVQIKLTALGKKLQKEVSQMQKEVACQTGLGEIEFEELRATLHQLVDTINEDEDGSVAA